MQTGQRHKIINARKHTVGRWVKMGCLGSSIVVPVLVFANDINEFGLHILHDGDVIEATDINDNFDRLGAHAVLYEQALAIDELSNYVGLGTTLPMTNLDIRDASVTSINIEATDSDGVANLFFQDGNGGVGQIGVATQDGHVIDGVTEQSFRLATNASIPMIFGINTQEKLRLSTGGDLGIGVTNPRAQLEVKRDAIFDTYTSLGRSGSEYGSIGFNVLYTTTNGAYSYVASDFANLIRTNSGMFEFLTAPLGNSGDPISYTQHMTLTNSGSLGIGISTPAARLAVKSAVGGQGALDLWGSAEGGVSGTHVRHFDINGNQKMYEYLDTTSNIYDFISATGAGHLLALDYSTGEIGVGTTNPAYRLDVQGGQVNASGGLCINGDCKTDWSQTGSSQWTTSGTAIYYNSGSVGIGTSSPITSLDVKGFLGSHRTSRSSGQVALELGIDINERAVIYQQSGSPDLRFFIATSENGGADRMTITSAGSVGIGTTSPSQKLHVVGNVTADSYLTNSDRRLKREIHRLQSSPEMIECLQGVTYYWRDPESSPEMQIGLIAQDVEQCIPEVVFTDSQGYKSINYSQLVVPLIEVAKEQRMRIDGQDQRHAKLEGRIRSQDALVTLQQKKIVDLETRLARLEKRLSAP